jgi:hypothetical protein
VSTTECTPSDSIAELPVNPKAINFVTAIKPFPTNAAKMTFLEEAAAIY